MNDMLEHARNHYRTNGLVERLRAALAVLGPEEQALLPEQLAPLDQFHTGGLAATAELTRLTGITAGMTVLDLGAGLGGPARFLAASHGSRVVGVDLSEPFVEAGRYLTERTRQTERVSFQVADALDLPFDDGRFDAVFLQHVAMNIADRARLYGEIRRVLKSGGRFATYDIVSNGGVPHHPVPWARTPDASFLLTSGATRAAIEAAGFRALAWQDDTEVAKAWFAQLRAAAPSPPPLHLGLVMGPDFAELGRNLERNLVEGRLGVLTAVFEAASI